MALGFVGDAISLSGLTGTKVKCEVIGQYYQLWWRITSGGPAKEYKWPTSIVELDAATGEVFIEDTKTTELGSSGHAMELKCKQNNTNNLKILLVEKHNGCYMHLKNVIKRRWPNVNISDAEGPVEKNTSKIFLINKDLEDALKIIENIELGNTLFFFDPLRSVKYNTIEKVAKQRIKQYYKPGTEFIIFNFTSDWFVGRNDFKGLPSENNPDNWSESEKRTIKEADELFGDERWRSQILTKESNNRKADILIENYKERLRKWFRYVLPMPFKPKEDQLFHLILCSNFETGVRATKDFYSNFTGNPRYNPNNTTAFNYFKAQHPEICVGYSGNQKPIHWKILWEIIKNHEEGICDRLCRSFEQFEKDTNKIQSILNWLEEKGFLYIITKENVWKQAIPQYKLNWDTLKSKWDITPPKILEPLSEKQSNFFKMN